MLSVRALEGVCMEGEWIIIKEMGGGVSFSMGGGAGSWAYRCFISGAGKENSEK